MWFLQNKQRGCTCGTQTCHRCPAADNEDGWETEEEEEIVGGEEEPAANGSETRQQQKDDIITDGLNIADVLINVDSDRDNVLPLD